MAGCSLRRGGDDWMGGRGGGGPSPLTGLSELSRREDIRFT